MPDVGFGNSVLVLGGSIRQLPLIQELKKRGFRITLVDYTPSPVAKPLVDIHYTASTFDPIATLEVARKEKVDFLATMATDQPVHTAAFVSEKLALPFPLTLTQATAATDKTEMKKVLHSHSIPTPRGICLRELDHSPMECELSLPWVVKPADNQGQRGVSLIHQPIHLPQAFEKAHSHSRTGKVMVEEFEPGIEHAISGLVVDGVAHVLLVTRREHVKDKGFFGISQSHFFSPENLLSPKRELFQEVAQQIADAIQLRNTPLYIQAMHNEKGLRVIEFACRIGGAFESHTIPSWTDFPVVEAYANQLQGLPVLAPQEHEPVFAASHYFFCHPGKIAKILPPVQDRPNETMDFFFPLKTLGTQVGLEYNSAAKVGIFGVHGSTKEELERKQQTAWNSIQILDPQGKNLLIIPNQGK
ncbi:MAG TPA: ATP-grasp domain-containing protein [Thermotogota bacterium]|nr:ATP-grasp domain-containing protein [Thermotogota bacterium]